MTDPTMDCTEVDELAPSYAVGALEPAAERAVSAHLESCDRPHGEVRALVDGAAVLPAALEPVQPSPALRDRLMATIATTPQEHRAARTAVSGPIQLRPVRRASWWRTSPLPAALAAAALVAAVGFGAWSASLTGQLADRDAVLRAVASADAIHAASGAAGTGWVIESGDAAMFMADDLATLPAGSLYELWLIDPDDGPVAVGTVSDTDGIALVTLDRAVGAATTFAVTIESQRVEAPTTDPVMVAPLDA